MWYQILPKQPKEGPSLAPKKFAYISTLIAFLVSKRLNRISVAVLLPERRLAEALAGHRMLVCIWFFSLLIVCWFQSRSHTKREFHIIIMVMIFLFLVLVCAPSLKESKLVMCLWTVLKFTLLAIGRFIASGLALVNWADASVLTHLLFIALLDTNCSHRKEW